MSGIKDILSAEKDAENKLEIAKEEAQRIVASARETADKKVAEEKDKLEKTKQQKLLDQKEELKSVYTKITTAKAKEVSNLTNSAEPKVSKLAQKLVRSLS